MSRSSSGLISALALTFMMAGHGRASAQTAGDQSPPPLQFVVTYGEIAPQPVALFAAKLLLDHLTMIARHRFGADIFTVNQAVDRSNLFTLTEVWPSATAYAAYTGSDDVRRTLEELRLTLVAPLDERDGNLVTQ